MIIVKLSGGLGNQMFQYAFGRQLAHRHQTTLKLDIGGFGKTGQETKREYALTPFQINADLATQKEIVRLRRFPALNMFLSRWNIRFGPFVYERTPEFRPAILHLPNDVYLQGYWQDERYFVNIDQLLVRDFSLEKPWSKAGEQLRLSISKSDSVSIHIRRGDYLSVTNANKHLAPCKPEYYKNAIKIVKKQIRSPRFFIFSDDIEWAEKNLQIGEDSVFVSKNKNLPFYEELLLMSQCCHNIIANSTFSWWGAWLNQHHDKIVIAPDQWFNNPSWPNNITPKSWKRI